MNHFNEFDPTKNNTSIRPDEQKPEQNARWYGVSYQNNGKGTQISEGYAAAGTTPAKSGHSGRVAVICVLVSICLLLVAFLGLGVFLVDNFLDAFKIPSGNLGVNGDALNLGDNQTIYDYTDVNYDYASAFQEIVKSSDESLVGSENGSAGENKKSLIEVTKMVKDSVVEITTTIQSNRGSIVAGAGSGVIIHEDGVIVTNHHVIDGADKVYVRLTNGDTYEAAVRGAHEEGDIAILKITPQTSKPLTVAKLGYSRALALGEEVIAIGNPLGQLGGTVTNGIISATAREITVENTVMTLVQTNAAINAGNSGGGLFNMAGELIGVVNAKYSASGVEGLGFAIPIDSAYETSIKDLMEVGYIRGVPSIRLQLIEKTGGNMFSVIYGAYVYDPCGVPGIQTGDYIYSVDGTKVYGISSSALKAIDAIVRSHKVGDVVEVVVKRGDEYKTVMVELTEYVPDVPSGLIG